MSGRPTRDSGDDQTRGMHGTTGDDMASILEFRQPAFGSRQVSVKSDKAVSADIVLFPGVRYERWSDDAAPESDKPRRRARRRDHLELDD